MIAELKVVALISFTAFTTAALCVLFAAWLDGAL